MAKNTSRSNQCNCSTKSAFDKNLKASASSKKPKVTFKREPHPTGLSAVGYGYNVIVKIVGIGSF